MPVLLKIEETQFSDGSISDKQLNPVVNDESTPTVTKKSKYARKHIIRKEKRLTGDANTLTEFEVTSLIKYCHKYIEHDFNSLLLTMLITGRNLELLLDQNIKFLIDNTKLELSGAGFFIINWKFPKHHIPANFEHMLDRPTSNGVVVIPKELTSLLKSHRDSEHDFKVIESSVSKTIDKINQEYSIRLTLKRVRLYLDHSKARFNISELDYAYIAGENIRYHPASYYTLFCNQELVDKQKSFCDEMFTKAGVPLLTFPSKRTQKTMGSRMVLKDQFIREYFDLLLNKIDLANSSAENIEERHNLYTILTIDVLQICTLHRPVKGIFKDMNHFDFQFSTALIEDKGSKSIRRLPLARIGLQFLNAYLKYLGKLKENVQYVTPSIYNEIDDILKGKKGIFQIMDQERLFEANPKKNIASILNGWFPFPPNWHRHKMATVLKQQNVNDELIACFMGHETKLDHSLSQYSALSFGDLTQVSMQIDKYLRETLLVRTVPVFYRK
ncbi:hypothetical protein [Thalassotalea sp. SU-HH00458]|uniref:hypothetical protein n=1 Tax=Thalassotalea sp. SU-HH00458 TaxID=3127657 RepID=UPI0031039EE0